MKTRDRSGATIADIGRELGISAMTVSRALNGSPDVNEDTRRRVLQQAERLNYRPNRWARSLVTQKSHIIGIIVPDISHNFFSEITRAIQETVEPHGYDLMLCHTHGDAAREEAAINMLLGSRVDGLIVASQRYECEPGLFSGLLRDQIPFVLLDRFFPELNCPRVRTDDILVGELATQHLIDLEHRRIAHIRGTSVSVSRLRLEGYLRALQRNGIPVEERWIVDGGFTFDYGYTAMQNLLTGSDLPTAVFAVNDPSAIGAIRACRDAGLHVPDDLSIVGAGAIEGPLTPRPFLTTVDWSRESLGRGAAELLLSSILRSQAPHPEIISPPELLVRESTAAPVHEVRTPCVAQCVSASC